MYKQLYVYLFFLLLPSLSSYPCSIFLPCSTFSHFRGGQQAALSRDSTDSGNQSSSTQRRLRGIGVGSNGLILPNRNSDDDDDDEDDDIEEGRQRRGFDRLRAVSLSVICFVLMFQRITITKTKTTNTHFLNTVSNITFCFIIC